MALAGFAVVAEMVRAAWAAEAAEDTAAALQQRPSVHKEFACAHTGRLWKVWTFSTDNSGYTNDGQEQAGMKYSTF